MPSQDWGYLLSETHVPHEQCLTMTMTIVLYGHRSEVAY